MSYRKIPKISLGAHVVQRPFLRGLYLEGLILRGAYVWWKICVTKLIGLAYSWKATKKHHLLPFCFHWLCFILYLRAISIKVEAPRGLYLKERFNRKFFALQVWGAYIWRGLYMEGLIFWVLQYSNLKSNSVKL